MNTHNQHLHSIDKEIESLGITICAAEDWSDVYRENPDQHAKLIRREVRLETKLRNYFRELANDRVTQYITWPIYNNESIKAYDLDVIVTELPESEYMMLLQIMTDERAEAAEVGAVFGEQVYSINLGISRSTEEVMKYAREQSAKLIKGVNETTRNRIRQSIETSIALRETQAEAVARLTRPNGPVNNAKRAATIARTETVNAFNEGLYIFGKKSGAVAKQWKDKGAVDVCAINTSMGIIPFSEVFASGDRYPTAHVNCRCGLRLVYPEELEARNIDIDGKAKA